MRKHVMPYANNKCSYQPAHLHSLISTFVVRYLEFESYKARDPQNSFSRDVAHLISEISYIGKLRRKVVEEMG